MVFRGTRLAIRRLRRSWGFAVIAILVLGAGLAAVTAISSLAYAVLFRPMTGVRLEGLISLFHTPPPDALPALQFSWPDFRDLQDRQTTLTSVAASTLLRQPLAAPARTELATVEVVTGGYFRTLGVTPAIGRLLDETDDRPGASPVAVLGHDTWRTSFAGDRSAIGRTVRLAGTSFEIVGVAAPEFRGAILSAVVPVHIWVPAEAVRDPRSALAAKDVVDSRETRPLVVFGRLASGSTLDRVRTELTVLAHQLDVDSPLSPRTSPAQPGVSAREWTALATRDVFWNGQDPRFFVPFGAMVVTTLLAVGLLVASNVAGLSLSRLYERATEFAVKRTLGAGRSRLVRELLIEACLLVAAATVVGLIGAKLLLVALAGRVVLQDGVSIGVRGGLELPVLLVTLVLFLGFVLLIGALPAARVTSTERPRPERARRFRWLLAAQVAASTALLMVAGAFAAKLVAHREQPIGGLLDELVVISTGIEFQRLDPASAQARMERMMSRLAERVPHLRFMSLSGLPGGLGAPRANLATVDSERRESAGLIVGSGDALAMLSLKVLHGRPMLETDRHDSAPVAVLNAVAARRLFGTVDAVGRIVRMSFQVGGQGAPLLESRQVVGVVAGSRNLVTGREPAEIYVPAAQFRADGLRVYLVARSSGDPSGPVALLRREIRDIDSDGDLLSIDTASSLMDQELRPLTIAAGVVAPLGLIGLLVAMAGLTGQMLHFVARRKKDLGIHGALGATRRHVVELLAREILWTVFLGTLAGCLVGLAGRAMLAAAWPGIDVIDGFVALVAVLPGLAAAFALLWPIAKAFHVRPAELLRAQ